MKDVACSLLNVQQVHVIVQPIVCVCFFTPFHLSSYERKNRNSILSYSISCCMPMSWLYACIKCVTWSRTAVYKIVFDW